MKRTEARTSQRRLTPATLFSLMSKRLKGRLSRPRSVSDSCRSDVPSASSEVMEKERGAPAAGLSRRALRLALVAFVFCLCGSASEAAAATLYVDNPGDYIITNDQGAAGLDCGDTVTWDPGAGSQHGAAVGGLIYCTNAFGTIQDAVNAATAGDTIRVAGGTFSELVTVNKQLFILGNQVGLDARTRTGVPESTATGASGSTAFHVTADDVTIDGFTVQGQTNVNQFGAGIVLGAGTEGSEVRNNIIQDNVVGIFLANDSASNQTVIERNLIRDNDNTGSANGTGIYSDQFVSGPTLTNVLIQDNRFAGNNFTFGLNLQNATSSTVTNNAFETGNAARLANVDDSSFTNNAFSGELVSPPSGFQITGLNITSANGSGSNNVTVSGNTFTNRRASAVSVSGVSGNLTLTNNTVTQDVSVFAVNTLRAMISLTGLAGTNNVTNNTITLTGVMPSGAGVNGIAVQGNFTNNVNITANTLNGGNTDTFTGTNDSHGIGIFGSGLGLPSTPTPVFTNVNVSNNFVNGWVDGVASPNSLNARTTVTVSNNDLSGNSNKSVLAAGSSISLLNASANWHGSNDPAVVASKVSGRVDYTPWLDVGTDTSAAAGFQGSFATLHVDDSSPQTGVTGRIQEGIILATGLTPTVIIEAGTYLEAVAANKASLTLDGATGIATDVVIDPPPPIPSSGDGIIVSANNVTIRDLRVTGAVNGISAPSASSVSGLTITNVQSDTNTGVGVRLSGVTGTTALTDVNATGNTGASTTTGHGLFVASAETLNITGGNFNTNTNDGLSIQNTTTATLTNVTATGNMGAGTNGLEAVIITTLNVSGGTFGSNDDDGIDILVAVETSTLSNVALTNNGDLGLVVGDIGGGQTTLNLSDLTLTGNGGGGGSLDRVGTVNFTATTGAVVDVVNITATQFQHTRAGSAQQAILYTANVPALNVNGDGAGDTFNVKASPNTTISIDGDAPTTSPGDALNYDAEGRTVSGDLTPPDGQIVSPTVQNVNFQEIEHINFANAINLGLLNQPWNSAGSRGAVDEEDLTRAELSATDVALKSGQTGTVRVRYNITAVDGISAFDPAGSSGLKIRFQDTDGTGADARVFFTIRRTNITTGGNEVVFTFDSNAHPPGGLAFQTVELCEAGLDFDFTQYVYWIEAEVSRAEAAQQAALGSIEILENPGACPAVP
jgi:hypothetical protein